MRSQGALAFECVLSEGTVILSLLIVDTRRAFDRLCHDSNEAWIQAQGPISNVKDSEAIETKQLRIADKDSLRAAYGE